MSKCNFCESKEVGNGNVYAYEENNSVFTEMIYWGNGQLDITGGIENTKLEVCKSIKINYCPICGKEL